MKFGWVGTWENGAVAILEPAAWAGASGQIRGWWESLSPRS